MVESEFVLVKITLRGIDPSIWRSFSVPTDITFNQFHQLIQTAMGWSNTRSYKFRLGDDVVLVPEGELPRHTTNSKKEKLNEWLLDGVTRLEYIYDFGDGWEHDIEFGELRWEYFPVCVEGARACPPEDCGGIPGYKKLVKILADPKYAEHRELRDWAGNWDPDRFDLAAVNQKLKRFRTGKEKG